MTPPVPPAESGFSPLDAELGLLPNHRFTPRVEEILTRLGASLPFAEAAAVLEMVLGVAVSEATERRRTYAAGQAALAVEETELQRVERELPVAETPPERVQISLDATKVPLVGGVWTDVKRAAFADLVPGRAEGGRETLVAVNLSYAARWEPAESFGRTITLEASHRGLDEADRIISPNDGADWIQGNLDRVASGAVRILDESHGAEHLGTIAGLLFGENTAAAREWTATQRRRLKEDPAAVVLTELARCLAQGPRPGAPVGPDGETPQHQLAREVAYFQKRADQIESAAFQALGYPIGSGIVESGHRVVIGPRCKGAGQHWATPHLNPLLVLRTIICNDRWGATWPVVWTEQLRATTEAHRRAHQHRLAARQAARAAPPLPEPVCPSPAARRPEPAPPPSPPPHPKPAVAARPPTKYSWRKTNSLFFRRAG